MIYQHIRDQAACAWQEAWWEMVPHTQLSYGRGRVGCLKWYW